MVKSWNFRAVIDCCSMMPRVAAVSHTISTGGVRAEDCFAVDRAVGIRMKTGLQHDEVVLPIWRQKDTTASEVQTGLGL
jgi:hypothetical protein